MKRINDNVPCTEYFFLLNDIIRPPVIVKKRFLKALFLIIVYPSMVLAWTLPVERVSAQSRPVVKVTKITCLHRAPQGDSCDHVSSAPLSVPPVTGLSLEPTNTVYGRSSLADGHWATAIGTQSHAQGYNATAIGSGAVARADHSVVLGADAAASAQLGIAIGHGASADGEGSLAIGGGYWGRLIAQASGDRAIAIGLAAKADTTNAVALGGSAHALAANSIALGARSLADRVNTVSVGSETGQRQITQVAAGTEATDAVNLAQLQAMTKHHDSVYEWLSVSAPGSAHTQGANSMAMGPGSVAGESASALGAASQAQGAWSLAVGSQSIAEGPASVAVGAATWGDEQASVLGMDAHGNRSAAVVGYQAFAGEAGSVLGTSARTEKAQASAFGHRAQALGLSTTALGADTAVYGLQGLAAGYHSVVHAHAHRGIAIGAGAEVSGMDALALGAGAQASEDRVVSVGSGDETLGPATRRIVNVAAAIHPSDAVNFAQMQTYVRDQPNRIAALPIEITGHRLSPTLSSTAQVDQGPMTAREPGVPPTSSVTRDPRATETDSTGVSGHAYGSSRLGTAAQASDPFATAVGHQARAFGQQSVSLGYHSLAGSAGALSLGSHSQARGRISTAVGYAAQAQQEASTAVGSFAVATGIEANALGKHSLASGEQSLALGHHAQAVDQQTTALGSRALAQQIWGLALGAQAQAGAVGSVAMGALSRVNADHGLALGYLANVEGLRGIAVGPQAFVQSRAPRGLALGSSAGVLGADSVALGAGARAEDDAVVSIGSGDSRAGPATRLLVNVGPGAVTSLSHQAVTGGQLYQVIQDTATAFGGHSQVDGQSLAQPQYAVQGHQYSSVGSALAALDVHISQLLGQQPSAPPGGQTVGTPTTGHAGVGGMSSAQDSAASGEMANVPAGVAGGQGTVSGRRVQVDAHGSMAIGMGARVTSAAPSAVVVGEQSAAHAANATVVGQQATVTAPGAVALGQNAVADRPNTVSVGRPGQARQIVQVAPGTLDTDAVNKSQLEAKAAMAMHYTDRRVGTLAERVETYQRQLDRSMQTLDRRVDRQGAMSAAMLNMATSAAGIRTDNRIGVGVGFQGSERALAVGFQRTLGEQTAVTVGGALSGSERSVGIGAGFGW